MVAKVVFFTEPYPFEGRSLYACCGMLPTDKFTSDVPIRRTLYWLVVLASGDTHLAITVTCLYSLNRCYFFFVLRCLSLQTSGFPLEYQVVLPQHSDCQDVEVPPQIQVWCILFCCYLLSVDRCYFVNGTPGILHFHVRTALHHRLLSFSLSVNHLSGSAFPCQFCLPWTLLQEAHP